MWEMGYPPKSTPLFVAEFLHNLLQRNNLDICQKSIGFCTLALMRVYFLCLLFYRIFLVMYIQGIRYGYVESLYHKDILWRGQYCCLQVICPSFV